MRIAFALFALGFLGGAVYHAVGLAAPHLLVPAPAWRHALFVAVNVAAAAGVHYRPSWVIWPFAALTAQQVIGHAIRGVRIWREEGRVDWPSVIVLIALPLLLALLIRDRRAAAGGG